MKKEKTKEKAGTANEDFRVFNLRKIPKELFFRMKMAAAAEEQTSTDWLLGLAESRIKELETMGKLPKS